MSVDIIGQVAEIAAKSNITLGLEVVNRYRVQRAEHGISGHKEFCRRVKAPNVKVHLDVYHMNIEKSDIASAIRETGDYLGYFHTGDSHPWLHGIGIS